MKTPTIETERLLLRPLVFEDCYEAFERWTSDPDVARYMRYNAHKSVEETKEWLSTVDTESDTAYDFAICVKAEGNYL
ncbi:MAG: GNAT family N-acetyltransferase, partial [Lachnospiraceae bacterium]|nr:GNAT family N-acetyltransferase [Lachnospiraceae bacterium]